jgi:hypothetical protein
MVHASFGAANPVAATVALATAGVESPDAKAGRDKLMFCIAAAQPSTAPAATSTIETSVERFIMMSYPEVKRHAPVFGGINDAL